jgi:hypothetical protein
MSSLNVDCIAIKILPRKGVVKMLVLMKKRSTGFRTGFRASILRNHSDLAERAFF